MLRLSLPVLLEETMFLAVAWTDWWLTSRFLEGSSPMAAMTVMGYLMWLIPTLFAAVAIGATALVSRHVGAGHPTRARETANQAMSLGLLFAGLITLFFWISGDSFVAIMQLEGESLRLGRQYFSILLPVIPLIMVSQISAACLRGAGDTVSGFAAKAVVVLINIGVSTALVSGFSFFPKMGWAGIALGTAIGHATGGIILGGLLCFGRAGLRLHLRLMKPDWHTIKSLLRIGIPGGFDTLTIVGSQLVFVGIINRLGEGAGAAHGLAVQIEALAWMPGIAFQVAAATMAGQYLGAELPRHAAKSALASLSGCLIVMCTAGVLLYFFGNYITSLFTGTTPDPAATLSGTNSKAEVAGTAAELLQIIAFAMPFLAMVMVFTGVLRGAGDTTSSLIISTIGFFAVRIPLALILAWPYVGFENGVRIEGFDLGVQGAWYAMVIDLFIRAMFVGGRFLQGGWQRIRI